ncbi:hypothetical protein H072_10776 [Dactylellina haptotyla CBS 200.50]|uniref:Uncharacterized protein n=1 Tax=Dactylellina haptotyla (strain CBS 200.50) TaxID=1284197 RepID=S7ZYJ6_DACHA|nr:hypothetical protein H072_10776 [Dactylellina haptotyla CBS 200.50]
MSLQMSTLRNLQTRRTANKQERIVAVLATIEPIKAQLRFHAKLLRRHSQPFLFLLENFKLVNKRMYWDRFSPYRINHLQVLITAIRVTLMGVEIVGDVAVDEALMRWGLGVRNRRLGKLILDSWEPEEPIDDKFEMDKSAVGSCNLQEFMEMITALWDEEVRKHYFDCFPEELEAFGYTPGDGHGGRGGYMYTRRQAGQAVQSENGGEEEEFMPVEVKEKGECWKGPTCLRRKNEYTLEYTTSPGPREDRYRDSYGRWKPY